MKKIEIDYNKTYYTVKGKAFKVIKEVEPTKNGRRILIRFESGYEKEIYLQMLGYKNISLNDYLSPSVCGVGMLGYASARANFKIYKLWCNMIYRCYDVNNSNYNSYGAKGVYVCDRWLRFDYYLADIVNLPGYEDMINNPDITYQLDKDTLQQGCEVKVYSPETCMWVPDIINSIQKAIDNKEKSNSKYFGVLQNKAGNYAVRITNNGIAEWFGTYSDEIAAANAYNYYAASMGRPMLNNVPYMDRQEFAKYLTQPLQMLVDENKFHGVGQITGGNYRVIMHINNKRLHLGIYTDPIAAANVYNHYAAPLGRPLNNVPHMSLQECRPYMTKLRNMCMVVNKDKGA